MRQPPKRPPPRGFITNKLHHRIAAAASVAPAAKFTDDNVFAWLTPSGTVHLVRQYGHLKFLQRYYDFDVPPGMDEYRALAKADREAEEQKWEDKLSDDEHPCWHVFEDCYEFSPDGEIASKFLWLAYEAGWGRLGTFGGDKLELECSEENARSLKRAARKLAEEAGRDLIVTVAQPFEPYNIDNDTSAVVATWTK